MAELRQIGAVARELGLTPRTLRYYEELGLIKPAHRLENGLRIYDDEAYQRLKFIKRLQSIGYPLSAIRLFLATREGIAQSTAQFASVESLEQTIRDLHERYESVQERVGKLEEELLEARSLADQFARDIAFCRQNLEERRLAKN
ncbi:MerR family transcriptional regulator [Ktedonosporobacter rubrisoli]|uniref:MerR family transcriptional regulator n=1 Tax=Ktedonosporobacter rubrisoli TaxID=2509675 RepID=A0A4P6JTD7_KTERU|nr:MerR family transcriptional regulator [Ktedonosporobacter rubrisoli]QBD78166.1 MerR family transcriptional regulator [Ktedonosporobacter rubrisoli]